VLSDNDNVYTEVRHMHMREAIDKLIADFNTFLQENAGFKGSASPLESFVGCSMIPAFQRRCGEFE
jgi:hypothetical protein